MNDNPHPTADIRELRKTLGRFQATCRNAVVQQVATSLGGYIAVLAAMVALAGISPWLALVPAPVAAGLLVRVFIIQHDCGHGSFLASRRANDALGFACSLLTLTPYAAWRRQHAGHHGMWNNLDRRETGADIYSTCLTVAEYRALPPLRRLAYRASRHPLIANLVLPPLVFLVLYRFPFDMPKHWKRERRSVLATNLALAGLYGGLGVLIGYGTLALVWLPVVAIGAILGVWLFSVQHRAPGAVWLRDGEWSLARAALESSTYLRLPAVLRWFSGNIGFHHIHHLDPRIPNFRLRDCHEAIRMRVRGMSLRQGLLAPLYTLWDEERGRMVTCRAAAQA